MVVDFETMMYKNVVWHTYEIHFSQFELAMEDFNDKLVDANLTVAGPLFYALHNIPFDEKILIDIYIPIEQSYVPKESDLFFQSYFYIDEMLMTRVRDHFEARTEIAYDELFQYAFRHDYQINSPIFHILRGDDEGEWAELKVRVYKENDL